MRYRKRVIVEAMQFTTNNEDESPTMDRIVNWMNRGRDEVVGWHNGTNIFVVDLSPSHIDYRVASVGDWIVRDREGYFIKSESEFVDQFEPAE